MGWVWVQATWQGVLVEHRVGRGGEDEWLCREIHISNLKRPKKKSLPAGIHQGELSRSSNKESRLLPAQYLRAGWVRCGPGKAGWAAGQLSRDQGCLCSGAGAARHRGSWRRESWKALCRHLEQGLFPCRQPLRPKPGWGLGNRLLFLPRTGGIKPKKGIVGVFTKEGRPAALLAGRAGGRDATAQPTGLGAHSPACPGLPLNARGPDPAPRCCRSWCCAGKEPLGSQALCAAGVGRQWGMRTALPSVNSPHSFPACTSLNKAPMGGEGVQFLPSPPLCSTFHPPSSTVHPSPSTFHPPSSTLHIPPTILRSLSFSLPAPSSKPPSTRWNSRGELCPGCAETLHCPAPHGGALALLPKLADVFHTSSSLCPRHHHQPTEAQAETGKTPCGCRAVPEGQILP